MQNASLYARSARVSDPADRRSPAISETFGRQGGSVRDRPQRGDRPQRETGHNAAGSIIPCVLIQCSDALLCTTKRAKRTAVTDVTRALTENSSPAFSEKNYSRVLLTGKRDLDLLNRPLRPVLTSRENSSAVFLKRHSARLWSSAHESYLPPNPQGTTMTELLALSMVSVYLVAMVGAIVATQVLRTQIRRLTSLRKS